MVHALALLAALLSPASDPPPGVTWFDSLPAACEAAGKDRKLVLLRQIVCACTEKTCAYDDLARNPYFLEDAKTRALARERLFAAVAHVAPGREGEGLHHPDYAPADYRLTPALVRTLFVTPTRHVVHRLDLCPFAREAGAEIAFALRVHAECYRPGGAPTPDSAGRMRYLHGEHVFDPRKYHPGAAGGDLWHRAAGSRVPWTGYAGGVPWFRDFAEAKFAAKRLQRPLLFYQIVGDMDRDGC